MMFRKIDGYLSKKKKKKKKIDGPLGEFIGFLPRVLWYEVSNHQYKYFEVVLDDFHDDF